MKLGRVDAFISTLGSFLTVLLFENSAEDRGDERGGDPQCML